MVEEALIGLNLGVSVKVQLTTTENLWFKKVGKQGWKLMVEYVGDHAFNQVGTTSRETRNLVSQKLDELLAAMLVEGMRQLQETESGVKSVEAFLNRVLPRDQDR